MSAVVWTPTSVVAYVGGAYLRVSGPDHRDDYNWSAQVQKVHEGRASLTEGSGRSRSLEVAQREAEAWASRFGTSPTSAKKRPVDPWPPYKNGQRVLTTQDAGSTDWAEKRHPRWGVEGVVKQHSDSHGLIYLVAHPTASGGMANEWYEAAELEEV